ncbi:hypothetical protein EV401DRAFT_1954308 [Pisolithus croceorrhizus]|nr:hypothetical protein EV401DRAFT_1954308 [Pisolithus croceorrhizus]
MASDGVYRVTLDEAIEAMRLTATDMSVKYKETSLSGLAFCDGVSTFCRCFRSLSCCYRIVLPLPRLLDPTHA